MTCKQFNKHLLNRIAWNHLEQTSDINTRYEYLGVLIFQTGFLPKIDAFDVFSMLLLLLSVTVIYISLLLIS